MSDDKKKPQKGPESDLVEDKQIGEIEQDIDEYLYSETKKKVGVKSRKKRVEKPSSRTVSSVKAQTEDSPAKKDAAAGQQKGESSGSKKAKKPELPIQAIIALGAAKIIFVIIPLTIISVIFFALILLKVVLQPAFVQNTAVSTFNKLAEGSLSMDVRKFNPYRGFVIENIVVKDSPAFGGGEAVRIDKLVFDYQFFSIFTGKIRFNEIGIYRPRVALQQKNGALNLAKLMKSSPPKAEKPKVKKEKKEKPKKEAKEKEPLKEINLPVNVSFFFKFILSDLSVSMVSYDNNFRGHLNDFTMSADIDIPPFKKVPLTPEAVKLIRLFDVKINPKERLDAGFSSPDFSIAPPLLLTFNLFYSGQDKNSTKFESNFKAGTSGTAIRFKDAALDPLSLSLDYALYYNPVTDYLNLDSFGATFAGDRLLNISGSVDKPITEQRIDMAITESTINLSKLYPYLRAVVPALKDGSINFSGNVSLAPLSVKGTPKDVLADGALSLNSILFSMPGFAANLPLFAFNYRVNYKEAGVFADTSIDMPGFIYTLGRDRSGRNNISLALTASSTDSFSHHQVQNLTLKLTDPVSRLDAFYLAMRADARTGDVIKANVNIDKLEFRNQPMQNTTPSALTSTLKSIPLKKPVTLNLQTTAEVIGQKQNVTLDLGLQVPDYDVNDMRLSTAIRHNGEIKRADIDRFRLSSAAYGLNLLIDGFADYSEPPLKDSDLRVRLTVQQDRLKDMYGGWNIKGLASLNAHMRGDTSTGSVAGNIFIKDFSVEHINKELPDAKLLSVSGVNLDFPYEYRFMKEYTGLSKIQRNQAKLISNDNFKAKRNFAIGSIKIAHPSRPKEYLEVLNKFDATMQFKNNSFDIVNLQASLLGGSLTMKDTLFYLADFSNDNMEYSMNLDIVNMNMGKLDRPDSIATDAYLSMTSSISGKGVSFDKKFSPKGNVNIYKIGKKIAGRLMKGLQDKEGRSKIGGTQQIVDNTMSVEGFDFFMDSGNVYTTVKLDPRFYAQASGVRIKNNEIRYDRIPIQEFLRNAREE